MTASARGRGGASGLAPAQDVIDQALEAAGGECVVIVEESSEAEVRFANNTTTTNGLRRDRRVTVISFRETDGGVAAGIGRRGGNFDVADLVAASERDAAGSPAAEDAEPLVEPGVATGAEPFDRGPGRDRSVRAPRGARRPRSRLRPSRVGRAGPGRVRPAHDRDRVPRHLDGLAATSRPTHRSAATGRSQRGRVQLCLGRSRDRRLLRRDH